MDSEQDLVAGVQALGGYFREDRALQAGEKYEERQVGNEWAADNWRVGFHASIRASEL
jgi:hypothetical protein